MREKLGGFSEGLRVSDKNLRTVTVILRKFVCIQSFMSKRQFVRVEWVQQ